MSPARAAAPPGYVHAASDYGDELARLRLLQERYDERTFARLSALGSLAGAVCLEVGAGAGSVARWLADPLEPSRYDLVHCRALLCHLPDPGLALRAMAAAVRPGGRLLAEDADYCSLVAADPAHPRSPRLDAVMRKLLSFIAASRAFDPFFGRRLPGLAASAGLAEVGREAIACHRQGASAPAEVLARSLERTRPRTLRDGVVGAGEFETVLAALRDPSFTFVDALHVAAWGQIPGPVSRRGRRSGS